MIFYVGFHSCHLEVFNSIFYPVLFLLPLDSLITSCNPPLFLYLYCIYFLNKVLICCGGFPYSSQSKKKLLGLMFTHINGIVN